METANQAKGHLHPLSQIMWQAAKIFGDMGFVVAEGPEIETEANNFDKLNIPGDHPARDMWDTFWLKPENARQLLRTHTSPVQARYMEANKPPLRIIAPGKVFRNEATDATHEAQFYQLEGLVVDKDISLANLKATLETFFSKFFGEQMEVRFRPSFFPFTEPSVEVDMRRNATPSLASGGAGKWIEIMGAGMVHPKVLEAVGLDPKEWKGFAFGCGVDRLAIMKYSFDDVRALYQDDLRFLEQF